MLYRLRGNEYLITDYAVLQDDLPMTLLYPTRFDIGEIIGGQDYPAARALSLCVAFYYMVTDLRCNLENGLATTACVIIPMPALKCLLFLYCPTLH